MTNWPERNLPTKNCDLQEEVQSSSDNYVFLFVEEMQSSSVQKHLYNSPNHFMFLDDLRSTGLLQLNTFKAHIYAEKSQPDSKAITALVWMVSSIRK